LGFELRALHLQSRHYHLSHASSPLFLLWLFWRLGGGLVNYLPGLSWSLNSLNLSLVLQA
jgi:hypothetical protein